MQLKRWQGKQSRRAVKEGLSKRKRQTPTAGGRRTPENADEIAARLLAYILGKHKSIYKYAQASPFSNKSVYRWVNPAHPQTPDAAPQIDLARDLGISLDWLLLGEGPESRGALVPRPDLADALRAQVVADIARVARADRQEVESVIPSGKALLNFATNAAASEFAKWRALRDIYWPSAFKAARGQWKKEQAARGRASGMRRALPLPAVTPSMVGWVPLSVP